jgi:ATP-dependent RNA helicase DDX51/DBP6
MYVQPFTLVKYLSCRKTLEAFKEGNIDVLIGTDIMARGIHIDGLKYVINYDMPPYVKTYIHRAGRTARAGESGSCFTFLRKHEVMTYLTIIGSFLKTIAMC